MNFEHFPRLNGLNKINLETTTLKLLEEAGELSQAISKFRGLNGENVELSEKEILEKIVEELLDVMQVCATMTYILEDKYNVNVNHSIEKHIEKLIKKGYVKL